MRALIRFVLVVPLSVPLVAQDRPDPATELQDKLASRFLQQADWTTDYDEAKRRAGDRRQLVFGYFTTAGY